MKKYSLGNKTAHILTFIQQLPWFRKFAQGKLHTSTSSLPNGNEAGEKNPLPSSQVRSVCSRFFSPLLFCKSNLSQGVTLLWRALGSVKAVFFRWKLENILFPAKFFFFFPGTLQADCQPLKTALPWKHIDMHDIRHGTICQSRVMAQISQNGSYSGWCCKTLR